MNNITEPRSILETVLVVFIVLKLLDVIQWSWWWVLAPLWGPAAIIFAAFLIMVIIAVLFRF